MTWQNEPSPENLDERDIEDAPHADKTIDGSNGPASPVPPPAPHEGEGTQARTPPTAE